MTVPRDSVPADRTWDDASVFPTVEAWEAELEAVLADLPGLAAFSGRLGESAAVLVEALQARDAITFRSGRVVVYALLGYAVETTDAAAVARFGRAQAADAQVQAAVAFVEPEVLAVGAERLRDWAASDPALAAYDHYLADLGRRAAHTRSAEVEEVLGLVSDVFAGPFGVYSALTDSDVVFAPAVSAEGDAGRCDAGLDRHAARERRPDVAEERLGELRGRLPRGAQHACGEPLRHGQAGGVPGARAPARLAARGVALAVERARWRSSTT